MTKYYNIIALAFICCLGLAGSYLISSRLTGKHRPGNESDPHVPSSGEAWSSDGAPAEHASQKQGSGKQNRRNPVYFANRRFDERVKRYVAKESEENEAAVSRARGKEEPQITFHEESGDQDAEGRLPDRPSVQEQAKKLLGIDAEEVFGVNMDVERNSLRAEMKMKTDARLVNMLHAQGMDAELIEKHLKIRQALMDKAKKQSLGTKSYRIETGLEEPPAAKPRQI